MLNQTLIRIGALLVISLLAGVSTRAEISQKQARKVIGKAAGMSLPSSAVHIERIVSSSKTSAEVSAELELVFRFARDARGQWRVEELRTAEARWEDVELIAQAANVNVPENKCNPSVEFGRSKTDVDLSNKRARCLLASLLAIPLPSDAVRIKSISALNLGPQPSALAVSLMRIDFRLTKDSSGWRVTEFHSGHGPWVNVESLLVAVNSLKRARTSEQMNAIASALEAFRRERGSFVVSERHAALIDNLSPHYLPQVIRVDSWAHPYRYQGERDHFTLRSLGPDGKENTADDIVVSR